MNTLPKEIEDIIIDYKNQMELKLWKLEVNKDTNIPHYDVYTKFVICAYSEIQARELAASECGDEGENVWLDNSLSKIELIANNTHINEPDIVIGSFHAG